jgi:hypothetical protein
MELFKNILSFITLYMGLKLLKKKFDSEDQYRQILYLLRNDFELCRMLLPEFPFFPLKMPPLTTGIFGGVSQNWWKLQRNFFKIIIETN